MSGTATKSTRERAGVGKDILRLALPAIVNNITVPLLGLCDTAIAGHLGRASYIGAMAVGSMMINVIYWLCGFLRMGTSGLTARAFGARDDRLSTDILRKSLGIAAVLAALAIVLQIPLLKLLTSLIAPDESVGALAGLYFSICIWSAPAQLGIMAVSGWFIGRQNTFVPMIVAVGVNLVNILLSLTLVFGFHAGFAGIACGTSAASWTGLGGALMFVKREFRKSRSQDSRKTSESEAVTQRDPVHGQSGKSLPWSRFFSVNTDLFFRSACIMAVSLTMTAVGARLGELTLAANAVIMQFFLFFSYFMDGFAFAGEALVGKAAGARDRGAMRGSVRGLVRWGAAMAVIFFILYVVAMNPITDMLTDNAPVRRAVAEMRIWVTLLPPITVSAFIFDGIYIGLSRTRPLLLVTLIASAAFFGIEFIVKEATNMPGNALLWTAFETYLLLRGVLLALTYPKNQRKSLNL